MVMAKEYPSNTCRVAIDSAHSMATKIRPTLLQRSKNLVRTLSAATIRLVQKITNNNQRHDMFARQAMVAEYTKEEAAVLVTHNSGADRHYISKDVWKKLGLPILRIFVKKVGVANGNTCKEKFVITLPFPQLSTKTTKADTLKDFPTLLMSVGKTAGNCNISIFTKDGESVYKEQGVLITCKGAAILISKGDKRGQYKYCSCRTVAIGNRSNLQTFQEISTTGQQSIQPTIYQGSNQVDTCSLQVTSQVHVAQGSQCRKLHWMATAHKKKHQKILR